MKSSDRKWSLKSKFCVKSCFSMLGGEQNLHQGSENKTGTTERSEKSVTF